MNPVPAIWPFAYLIMSTALFVVWLVLYGVRMDLRRTMLHVKPFGSSDEVLRRRPWEEMRKYFADLELIELYFGSLYIAVGTKVNPREVR